jgi:hypothetical protein
MRSSILSALHQILLGQSNQGGWLGGACSFYREMRNEYKLLVGKPEHLEGLSIDGMIILKCILVR